MRLTEIHSQPEPTSPLELRSLARYYQGQNRGDDLKQKLRAEWGKKRLSYHGNSFFGDDELGEAYVKAEEACRKVWEDRDFTVTFELEIEPFAIDGERFSTGAFDFNAHVAEANEVYLGYHAADDTLYMGFDASLEEEEFNEEWDRWFEQETGMQFDSDDHEHRVVFDQAWKHFTHMAFTGLLFMIHVDGMGRFTANEENVYTAPKGFYQGIYKQDYFKRLGLIDLRLD